MSHTPGPWKRLAAYVFAEGKHGGNICVIGEPRASTMVEYKPLSMSSKDIDEAFANARLIAAAPDLLAALEACIKYLPEVRWDGIPNHGGTMVKTSANAVTVNALEAIAKAKGGA